MRRLLLIVFLSLLTLKDVTAELNNDTISHITGSIRIKRSCMSNPVLQCMFKTDASSVDVDNCPHSVNNWSDVHCVNNSFGLYTPQSHFMELGTGPMGINLNDGFVQYVSYIPIKKNRHTEDLHSKKIEHLIEEKAKMEMRASFFERRFHELEATNQELRERLNEAEEKSNADSLQINSLTIRLNRWEQGSIACKQDMKGQQEKTSAALEICNNHIVQLEKENGAYMEANRELTDTVSKMQHSCDSIRASNTQCNIHIAECNTQLSICDESQHALELALDEQTALHQEYTKRTEKEYQDIHRLLDSARDELSECSASLDFARDRNNGLQESRNTCISRLSTESTLLKQCKDDLQRCHTNHSVSTDMHDECRTEISKFTYQLNQIQEQHMKCTSDLTEVKAELHSQRQKNSELMAAQNSQTSQLELLKHKNQNDEKRINELTNLYSAEKAHYQEVMSDLRSCQADVRAMTELDNTQKSEISELKEFNDELSLSKSQCLNSRENLARDLAVTLSRLHNTDEKLQVCQRQVGKYQTENDRLISTTTSLQSELSSLEKMHAVLVSQHTNCMAKHNVSIQTVDEWKDQYLQCDSENRNLTASLLTCETKKEFLSNMLKSLEQEAEVSLRTQENLASRLRKSTDIISDLTKAVADSDRRLNYLEQENARIHATLEEKQAAYITTNQQYMECSSNYSLSLQTVTELQHNAKFNSELLEALKNQAKETSDELVDVQASLVQHQTLLQQERDKVAGITTKLTAAQDLYANEQQMRQDVEIQLQHCRGNHTETVTESKSLEVRLAQCGHRVTELIENHEKEIQQIESRLSAITVATETAQEAHSQINASLHYCQKNQAQLQSEKETVQHQLQNCAQSLHLHITKTEYYINLKIALERRFESCNLELKKCSRSLQVQIYKLEQCNERETSVQSDLELVRNQLQHCNEQCKQSSLACPESVTGETYIITSSGCLMQTVMTGSEEELEQHCKEVHGHLLKLPANDEHFNKDIIEMLHYSGKHSTDVWISRSDQPEENCYSVNMSRVENDLTKPVEYLETSCETSLPGICFASLTDAGHGTGSSLGDISSLFSGLDTLHSGDSLTSINTVQTFGTDYELHSYPSYSSSINTSSSAGSEQLFSSILNE